MDATFVVKTRKGVVLATGGYAHNKKFPRRVHATAGSGFLDELRRTMSATASRSVETSGGRLAPAQGTSGLWTPVSTRAARRWLDRLVSASGARSRQAGLNRGNAAGHRFVNEACPTTISCWRCSRRHQTTPRSRPISSVTPSSPAHMVLVPFIRRHRNPRRIVDARLSYPRAQTLERARRQDRCRCRATAVDGRAPQQICRNRHRCRFRQGRDRAQPLQWRRRSQAQSLHRARSQRRRSTRWRSSGRHRGQHRTCNRCRCARARR